MLPIIIINYHSAADLHNCLQSIKEDNAALMESVIVVSNSYVDNVEQKIASAFPNITWIDMSYNAGFARANNVGIRASTGDVVLLLNPDTLILNNAISSCYEKFIQSHYIACGVQLLNEDGSPQISGNYVMKGALNYLMQVPYFGVIFRWMALKAGVSKTNLPEATKPVTEVDWINGAFLMVKRSAIEKAGLLDEDFFLYHEESEWCSRLRKIGKLCIFGDLHVVHLEGQSAIKAFDSGSTGYGNMSDKKGFQLMLSLFIRFRKEFGIGWFLFHLLFYTACVPFIMLCGAIESLFVLKKIAFTRAIGYSKNLLKCWSYLFTITLNKPHFYKVL